jgi:hypothetical protein
MASKTTITIESKHRAAYEVMRAEVPGLTLSDFVAEAITFYLAYKDEASFRPLVRHLGTITEQLKTVARPEPPINQERFAELVSKYVVGQLMTTLPPPAPEVPGWRGWLIRRWQGRDIAHTSRRPMIWPIRQR